VPLPPSLRLSVYTDYSGPTLSTLPKLRVGFVILLTVSSASFSLLYWASHRPHRVCRGSTAGKLLSLAHAVAAALDIHTLLQELISQRVFMDAYTDSAPAYDLITSFKDPADISGKRDLYMLRRALLDGTLSEINHVSGSDNPADAFSKPMFSRPSPHVSLSRALSSGALSTPLDSLTTTQGYRTTPLPGPSLLYFASAPPPAPQHPHPRRHAGKCTRVIINPHRPTHPRRPPRHPATHAKSGCALRWTTHPHRRPRREVSTVHDSFFLGSALASIAPSSLICMSLISPDAPTRPLPSAFIITTPTLTSAGRRANLLTHFTIGRPDLAIGPEQRD